MDRKLGGLIAVSLFAATLSGGAIAYNYYTPINYPMPRCNRPVKPFTPYNPDQYAIERYNKQVDDYNRSLLEYQECISNYVTNAQKDIGVIQERVQDAIQEFNSPY